MIPPLLACRKSRPKLAAEREPNDSDTVLMLAMTYGATGQNALAQETARTWDRTCPTPGSCWR